MILSLKIKSIVCRLFWESFKFIILSVIMLSVIVLNVVMLNVIMLIVIMPSVIMLNVVMLSVVASFLLCDGVYRFESLLLPLFKTDAYLYAFLMKKVWQKNIYQVDRSFDNKETFFFSFDTEAEILKIYLNLFTIFLSFYCQWWDLNPRSEDCEMSVLQLCYWSAT